MSEIDIETVKHYILKTFSKTAILEIYFKGPKYCCYRERRVRHFRIGTTLVLIRGGEESDIEARVCEERMSHYYYSLKDLNASLPLALYNAKGER